MTTPAPAAPAAPATPPASAPAATPAAPAAAPNDWTSGFNDDMRGYIQNKGFKDAGAAIESYRNLEKLMGAPQERILKLPEKTDDPAWNDIYGRLGRPTDPKEYKFAIPEGMKENTAFTDWARKTFHETGLSSSQAEKIVSKHSEFLQATAKAQQEAFNTEMQTQATALKKEWGAAYDQNVQVAKRAALGLGLDGATIDKLEMAMGHQKTIKMLHDLGSKMGEDAFVIGKSGGSALTPEAAQNRINALRADPGFTKNYLAGDVSAREEMARLHQMAYPEPQ